MKLPAFLLVGAICVVVGCGTGTPGPSAVGSTSSPASTLEVPTVPPATATAAVAEPTASPLDDAPPSGALGYSDFADVGWLGTYCWRGLCADVPELPDIASLPEITVPEGTLIFTLDGAEFAEWNAKYGADSDSLSVLDEGGSQYDPDASPAASADLLSFAELESPPPGDWVVTVQVFMPEGDATYAWHVVVE